MDDDPVEDELMGRFALMEILELLERRPDWPLYLDPAGFSSDEDPTESIEELEAQLKAKLGPEGFERFRRDFWKFAGEKEPYDEEKFARIYVNGEEE